MNKNQQEKIFFNDFNDFCEYFDIEKLIESPFFNQAITHSSISKKHCYERLEFLGDTILNFCVSKMLFIKYPSLYEGQLSKKKSYLISRKVCRQVAKDIALEEKIKYSKKSSIKNVEFLSADVVESIICAVYFEFGIEKTYNIITTLFAPYDIEDVVDPKMVLQEYAQKKYQTLPQYSILKQEGTENEPVFTAVVVVNQHSSTGIGKTKKNAEKQAAERLLEQIKKKNN